MYKKIVYDRDILRGKKKTHSKSPTPCSIRNEYSESPSFSVSWKPLVEIRTVSTWTAAYVKMASEFFVLSWFLQAKNQQKSKQNKKPNWLNRGRFRVNNYIVTSMPKVKIQNTNLTVESSTPGQKQTRVWGGDGSTGCGVGMVRKREPTRYQTFSSLQEP